MDDKIETIYNDNILMIKNVNDNSTDIYYLPKMKNNHIRIAYAYDTTLTKEQADFIAPIIKNICDHLWYIAHVEGYRNGKDAGRVDLQNELKELLGLNSVDKKMI